MHQPRAAHSSDQAVKSGTPLAARSGEGAPRAIGGVAWPLVKVVRVTFRVRVRVRVRAWVRVRVRVRVTRTRTEP